MKLLLIDVSRCNNCQNYQIICDNEGADRAWSFDTGLLLNKGQFYATVDEQTGNAVPQIRIVYLNTVCQDCEDTPCVQACSQKAIYREKDGVIIIDPLKCAEKKTCISACPYGIIHITNNSNLAHKRNWCDQELDSGWKEPRCIDACPTVAFLYGEEEILQDLINKADRLYPGAKTITFYIGDLKAKRLSGATVYDSRKNITLKESTLTLKNRF